MYVGLWVFMVLGNFRLFIWRVEVQGLGFRDLFFFGLEVWDEPSKLYLGSNPCN